MSPPATPMAWAISLKRPLPFVVKQEVAPVSGDEQVEPAVVVVVDHARPVAAEVCGTPGGIHSETPPRRRRIVTPSFLKNPFSVPSWFAVNRSSLPSSFMSNQTAPTVFLRVVDAHVLRHVDELPAVVVKEHVGRVSEGHEEIDAPVVVEINPRHLPRFAFHVEAEVVARCR